MAVETLYPIQGPLLCFHNLTVMGDQRLFNLPYHRHDAYEIYLFLSGNVSLYIEQSCYQLVPGDFFLITPNQLHRSVCQDNQPYERIVLNIKEEIIQQLSTNQSNLSQCFHSVSTEEIKHIHLRGEYNRHYQNLFNLLLSTINQTDFGQDVLANSYLAQLLVFLNMRFSNYSSPEDRNIMPELIRNLMVYITDHLTDSISLSDLSKVFYLNGTYISRQFKKHTGLTLYSYILDQRIALAKKLLKDGCNVSEACYQSGFTDYANFIRSFTSLAGISPGRFAKQLN